MAQKIILLILGVLLIVGGVYCIATPAATFAVVAPLAAIGMIVDAVGGFVSWNNLRKAGGSSALMLIASILSLILGVVLLGSFGAQLAFDLMVAYMVAAWLTITGVLRIVVAVNIRKIPGSKWVALLIFAILMVVVGIMGFANPLSIALALGMMIGISILFSGFGVFSLALAIL